MSTGYNPWAVHANRGLGAFQNKLGANCPQFLWNRGNPILFNGQDAVWLIVPSSVKTAAELGAGGFVQNRKLRFSALIAQFYNTQITTPEQLRNQMDDDPIGYLGGSYKVTSVEIAPTGLVIVVDANALDQGA